MKQTHIILGVSASISAYKAADLTNELTKRGYAVDVLMTKNATKFITPLTLQSLSKRPVHIDVMAENQPDQINHIDLAKQASLFLVAPATANTIGKLANGIADDMLDGVELQADTDYHLDGTKGLSYARYRKYDETTGMGDPDGDIGRQKRQREVIEKIVKKVLSLDSVTNYQKILKAVEKNTKTDLVWADMLDIANHYRNALSKIKQLQLQGEGDMYNGIYYQFLGMDSLLDVQNTLKEQLGIQPSETLPQQDQYTDGYADYRFYNDSDSETNPSVTEGETLQANGGDTSGYTETDDYEEGTASQDAGYTEDAGYEVDAGYTEEAGYTGDAGYAEDPGYTDDNGSDNAVETDPATGYYDDTNAGYEEDYTETY